MEWDRRNETPIDEWNGMEWNGPDTTGNKTMEKR
jgi:hypothetical protein